VFETKVERARWREEEAKWEVQVTDREGRVQSYQSDILISATGVLNIPLVPHIKGMDSFRGTVIHSSSWPEDLNVEGKCVAVIGNGASAMQIVPAIASKVSQLTIFARSKLAGSWPGQWRLTSRRIPRCCTALNRTGHSRR
jgi:4-hydroxyacetophenone monooxygenase